MITWPDSPGVTGRGKVYAETHTTKPTRIVTRPKQLAINRSGAERFSRGCRSLTPLPRRGRSAAFASPHLNAADAHHVWLPDAASSVLPAIAEPVVDIGTRGSSVFFPALPCLEHILIDSDRRQHVVLRAN